MDTELETNPQHELLPASPSLECPLHLAIRELASVAVKQHVLYLEGECQPRPDLLRRLETWSALHSLIRSRACVASRESVIAPDELERALDALLSGESDTDISCYRQQLSAALAGCAAATSCPFGTKSEE